jgi:hypothetical protein
VITNDTGRSGSGPHAIDAMTDAQGAVGRMLDLAGQLPPPVADAATALSQRLVAALAAVDGPVTAHELDGTSPEAAGLL